MNIAHPMSWIVFHDKDRYEIELSPWAWPVLAFDAILIIPLIFAIGYTLSSIYSVLTIIEDDSPPAYDLVAPPADGSTVKNNDDPEALPVENRSRPVTSSIRSIDRVLSSTGGYRASFRGITCAIALYYMTGIIASLLSSRGTGSVGKLLASLAVIQFSAAWVHIVISTPSTKHFWRRLPPFQTTIKAAWAPVVLAWIAEIFSQMITASLATALEFNMPDVNPRNMVVGDKGLEELIKAEMRLILTAVGLCVLSVFLYMVMVIPSQVVLTRVLASLLPDEDETIVPFDRTFRGKIEPAVVGGRGYASIADAWSTFTPASWRRLMGLYAKITLLSLTSVVLLVLVLIPQGYLLVKITPMGPS